jgi:hypothetical protein
VKLPDGWRAVMDLLCASAVPFDDSCFRSVELAWAHPDDVTSGEGTRLNGGRFATKGTRAVYASLDEGTATREVTARKVRLGGRAQIALKDYPVSPMSFRSKRERASTFGSSETSRFRRMCCERSVIPTILVHHKKSVRISRKKESKRSFFLPSLATTQTSWPFWTPPPLQKQRSTIETKF